MINAILLHGVWFLKTIKDLKMGTIWNQFRATHQNLNLNLNEILSAGMWKHTMTCEGKIRTHARSHTRMHSLSFERNQWIIQCVQKRKKKHWLYKQIFFWVTFIFKIMWYVQFIKLQLNYLMAKYYLFLATLNWGSENTYYAVNVAILTVLRPKIVSWTFFSFVYNIK